MSAAGTPDRSRVCVVGVGAVTAIGLCAPASAAAQRAGVPGFAEHPFMISREGEPMVVARVPGLDDAPGVIGRMERMATMALRETLEPLRRAAAGLREPPLFVGLPPERPGTSGEARNLPARLAAPLALGARTAIATGHAAGLMALQSASEAILGGASFAVAGGVDSYMEPETLEWVEAGGQLHGGSNAWGFIPGEGAGFVLLASEDAARSSGLPVLARVWSAAVAHEPNRIKTETVCLGKGLTEAFRGVLGTLASDDEKIDEVICDMNGEPYRADEYGFTLARTSTRFRDASDFVAPADTWGDIGAASGPLFVGMVAAAHRRGYATARTSLLWASSESGERAAVILVPGAEGGR